jgi:hypothetical protein
MDDGAALAEGERARQQQRARFLAVLASSFILMALLAGDTGLEVSTDDSGTVTPPPTPDVRMRQELIAEGDRDALNKADRARCLWEWRGGTEERGVTLLRSSAHFETPGPAG